MFTPDIFIEMAFNVDADTVQIRTNAKHEVLRELIDDYLETQIGTGRDNTPPVVRDVYKISIGVKLANDSWGSSHDCGNKGLREGILMRIMTILANEPSKATYVD